MEIFICSGRNIIKALQLPCMMLLEKTRKMMIGVTCLIFFASDFDNFLNLFKIIVIA